MAVVDAHERSFGVVVAGDGLAQLRRIDLISRFGCGMHVPSANQPIHHLTVAEEQTAAFAWRRRARVRHDLIPQTPREDDAGALDQQPPAIAGMTMTSLPSGTTAPLPPRVRASSSPM